MSVMGPPLVTKLNLVLFVLSIKLTGPRHTGAGAHDQALCDFWYALEKQGTHQEMR